MKLPSFLASLSLLGLTLLAGCPSNDHDAKFSAASDQQLGRTYAAASGSDMGIVALIGALYSGTPSDSTQCPRILTSGQDTTLSGGCDTTDGDHWEGQIVIHNMPGIFTENPAYDDTQPGSVSFEALHITNASSDFESKLDGVVSFDFQTNGVDENLTLLTDGVETTTVMSLACDQHSLCTADADADLELTGLGGAGIAGTWSLDTSAPAGTITLQGDDTLVIDQSRVDANGCAPYTIGAKSGTVCDPNHQGDASAARKLTALQRVMSPASKNAQR